MVPRISSDPISEMKVMHLNELFIYTFFAVSQMPIIITCYTLSAFGTRDINLCMYGGVMFSVISFSVCFKNSINSFFLEIFMVI